MRYFFDTEFIEDGLTIDLISLGMVSEDGRELYLINKDANHSKADDWVKENVIAQLPPCPPETDMTIYMNKKDGIWCPHASFKSLIWSFVGEDDKPEFWSYYSSYDWVALCQCWGRMLDIPKHFPKYCRDLKQLIASMGITKLPKQLKDEHNALADAHWIKEQFETVNKLKTEKEEEILNIKRQHRKNRLLNEVEAILNAEPVVNIYGY